MPAHARDSLRRGLAALFPGAGVRTYATGRAALAEALRMAMRVTGRRRVVLPAFTSYSVAAAAAHAGASVDLCDLDPVHWDLDRVALRRLVGADTAAVVLGNLFGTPDRTDDLGWLAGTGTILVDDAAQALGAREAGRAAGSRGGLGVLSFGRGKCVTLGDAGALLCFDAALAAALPAQQAGGAGLRELLMAGAMRACVPSVTFGLISRLPGGRIGESWYDPAFPVAGAARAAEGLAEDLPEAVERQLAIRRRVAGWWREALAGLTGLERPVVAPGMDPAFLRFPVLAPDTERRARLVEALAVAKFAYVRSFPTPLGGIPGFLPPGIPAGTPLADGMAGRLIALPCHAGVRRAAVARAAAVFHT
jgi:dTDP-4-amino-4,6-dideoxygalactose transaminase